MFKVKVNYTNGTSANCSFPNVFHAHNYAHTMCVLEWVDNTQVITVNNNKVIATYR